MLRACPGVTVLTTSREPIGMTGEVIWRVSSLSITDEAVELFTDRARLVRPEFAITDENTATVAEICQRLDGMPLAIELAAARVRALSVTDILSSLHDRFRLLTGGTRTAVRRQQTLRASVDWSHALLTDIERLIFRRLAVFRGGFHLDAAEDVAADDHLQRHQVLDELTLLVDKSLVIAENTSGRTRYRLLETIRQYALEKLGESGEADVVRARHRDHYTRLAMLLDQPGSAGQREHVERADSEIDNLRAAFTWSCDTGADEVALQLASALQPLWLTRGRVQEGLSWIKSVLSTRTRPRGRWRPPLTRGRSPTTQCSPQLWATQSAWRNPSAPSRSHERSVSPARCYMPSSRAGAPLPSTPRPRAHTSMRRQAWPANPATNGD